MWRVLFAVLTACSLQAERYALLVGVDDERPNGLVGPSHDVASLSSTLQQRHGYSPSNVITLLNEQATRETILQALDSLVARLKDDGHLLFYFSGHGTSAFDKGNAALATYLGRYSGALVPRGIDRNDVLGTLLVGWRDLRPILLKMPAQAEALVILDACFSENSAKSLTDPDGWIPKGIPIETLLKGAPLPARSGPMERQPPERYPYANVVSLAAAGKAETAAEIRRTIDGLPHGALTNSLLAGLLGGGDTNRDGTMTYREMFQFVREHMSQLVSHSPQLLAATEFSLERPVLGGTRPAPPPAKPAPSTAPKPVVAAKPVPPKPTPPAFPEPAAVPPSVPAQPAPAPAARIRLKLVEIPPDVAKPLRSAEGIEIVEKDHDMMLAAVPGGFSLFEQNGSLVKTFVKDEAGKIPGRVRANGPLARLRAWKNPDQLFNVRIDAEAVDDKFKAQFQAGDKVKLRIGSERPAYLLLLNIDKSGNVVVLFPGPDDADRQIQSPRKDIDFLVEAVRPAGSEHLKLLGFPESPPQWSEWACRKREERGRSRTECHEFGPEQERFARLLKMLDTSTGVAQATLRVTTVE